MLLCNIGVCYCICYYYIVAITRGLFHERILDLCLSYNLSHDLSKKVRMT